MDLQNLFNFVIYNYVLDQVCYPPYGCFDKSPPFDQAFLPLPNDPSKLDTSFRLYNRLENGTEINNQTDWKQVKTKLIIIAHGFLESGEAKWMHNVKDTILKVEEANVVLVNWNKAAAIPYTQAVSNMRVTSAQIAHLLQRLFDKNVVSPSQVHLIGFSLGAHLMGYVGKYFKNKKLQRITGLDPAGPLFTDSKEEFRLDKNDALYVDVIHTDGKSLIGYSTGSLQKMGHADFYPNGGFTQPGCKELKLDLLTKKGIYDHVTCNHYRAVIYFLESIEKSNKYYAYKCSSHEKFLETKCQQYVLMGYHSNQQQNGKFYFFTNDKAPFSVYHYMIELETSKIDFADSVGRIELQLFGDKKSSKIELDKLTYLEQGETKKYLTYSTDDLGDSLKLQIKHCAGLYVADSWLLKSVIVTALRDNKRYCGTVDQWLKSEVISVNLSSCL